MIHTLSQDVINKIAAGEVVERPASIIKELIENSLDAGASNIRIELTEGGIKKIRVIDNGYGMSPEDAELAIEPHATSKINSVEDLFAINSFGFRGEALASIASVSTLTLRTRPTASHTQPPILNQEQTKQIQYALGTQISKNENGIHKDDISTPVGTDIEIQDLFYNVPARQKFLKSPTTEFRHCLDVITPFTIITPSVSWQIFHNQKPILTLNSTDEWHKRITALLGAEKSNDMREVEVGGETTKIVGFLGHPRHASEQRGYQYVFVNQRPVMDMLVMKAVKNGYGSLIPKSTHPIFILHLQVDPTTIDVNVHPRKLEVKYANTQLIFQNVFKAVQHTLAKLSAQMPHNVETELHPVFATTNNSIHIPQKNGTQPRLYNSHPTQEHIKESLGFYTMLNKTPQTITRDDSCEVMPRPDVLPHGWRVIGQAHDSYIITETMAGLMLMDQHAMSERINYEQMKQNQIQESAQHCAIPVTIDLPPQELALYEEYKDIFLELGFEIEIFGGNTLAIHSVPSLLAETNIKTALESLFLNLRSEMTSATTIEQQKDAIVKLVACKTAIKFGDRLTESQQIALITTWLNMPNNQSCIHGRPCTIELSDKELRKWFKRP